MAVAARAAGIHIIDGPFPGYKDLDSYRREAEWSAALGFDGKWAIHPAQVPVALEVYTPREEVVSKASKIIEKYREAEKQGIGAIIMDGEMIDAATYKIAEKILARKG